MPSQLTFDLSEKFRKNLIVKNLQPYNLSNYNGAINYETIQSDYAVKDSDNNLNKENPKQLVNLNGYIDEVYDTYSVGTPYLIQPYTPKTTYEKAFVATKYTPYQVFFNQTPGINQDSYLAKIGVKELGKLFVETYNINLKKETTFVNVPVDVFDVGLILSGQKNLINLNWAITVPENPALKVIDFRLGLNGGYFPMSPIPGDYFNENTVGGQYSTQTSKALSVANNLTGGLLGPILNLKRNPSQIFLANTGAGQKSALFYGLNYNKYQPYYYKDFGQQIISGIQSLFSPNGSGGAGGYYVGSSTNDPVYIDSPSGVLPINNYGQQTIISVYGPDKLGVVFEGNENKLKFGFGAKPLIEGGSVDGGFLWSSKKTNNAAGYHAKPGGEKGSKDDEFNIISTNIDGDKSTNYDFRKDSILDNTQKLVESADSATGINKLQHVGNAINQLSKVFHDGYTEMTKGSRVVSYSDNTTGAEAGIEYCRVFTKDTPYFTYGDLQKTDGITKSGRQFSYSVLDNTYNLNIAPIRGDGSTNIVKSASGKNVKKYMFSIENLAWRTSSKPGFTYDELPVCEKGPNGGRIMWFPPYGLTFNDSSTADWNPTTFLGRPEPIYTYSKTSRSGSIGFTILVDNPSVTNLLIDKQLNGDNTRVDSILRSFFAGCTKFDIYKLAEKFNMLSVNDLYTIQETLNNPQLTPQELAGIMMEKPVDNTNTGGQGADNTNSNPTITNEAVSFTEFENIMFYFENDYPNPKTQSVTSSLPFNELIGSYTSDGNKVKYKQKADGLIFSKEANKNVDKFFSEIIEPNYKKLSEELIPKLYDAVDTKKNKIVIEISGSASAIASQGYNVNLSKRRIDSVKKFLTNFEINGKTLKKFIDEKKIEFREIASGETGTIPTGGGNISGNRIECTDDINIMYNNKSYDERTAPNQTIKNLTKLAQVYSTDAMACRRVSLKITATPEPPEAPPKVEQKQPEYIKVQPTKPKPKVDIQKKIKEGISKKILRNLLTECDYFDLVKDTDPMAYDSLKSSLKYFNPAFHSITPEGLNARLTFLNQCLRPGETIPVVDINTGVQKVTDSINTAFGAPPILILRIGDFYHTKIVPTQLSFSYDKAPLDLNPEGIGVQPMLVNVTLSFNIIGGMGLKEPVEQLQNALSFNYYANTEIYDERATATEDTSKLDQEIVDAIVSSQKNTVNNVIQSTNDGGNTIGDIKSSTPTTGGEEGEISYIKIMDGLIDSTKSYITTITDQLEKITKNYNYGILLLLNYKRDYTDGFIKNSSGDTQTSLYGKPDQDYTKRIQGLVDTISTDLNRIDVGTENNPIIGGMFSKNITNDDNSLTTLADNIKRYVKKYASSYSNGITTIIQTIVEEEQKLITTIDKLNFISSGVDGKIVDGLTPKLYSITGSSPVSPKSNKSPIPTDTQMELLTDIGGFVGVLRSFDKSLTDNKIYDIERYDKSNYTYNEPKYLENNGDTRFYMLMNQIFMDSNKLEQFKNDVVSGNLTTIKNAKKFRRKFDDVCDDMVKRYTKEYENTLKIFEDYKKTKTYMDFTSGIESQMYPKGKERI